MVLKFTTYDRLKSYDDEEGAEQTQFHEIATLATAAETVRILLRGEGSGSCETLRHAEPAVRVVLDGCRPRRRWARSEISRTGHRAAAVSHSAQNPRGQRQSLSGTVQAMPGSATMVLGGRDRARARIPR